MAFLFDSEKGKEINLEWLHSKRLYSLMTFWAGLMNVKHPKKEMRNKQRDLLKTGLIHIFNA